MNLLLWVLFGLIVGVIANVLDPRPAQGGAIGAIVLGVLGAVLGGFLGDLMFGVGITGFNLYSFLLSVAGALIILLLSRAFRRV